MSILLILEEEIFRVTEAINLLVCMTKTTVQVGKTPPDQLEIPELQAPQKNLKFKEHKEVELVHNDPEKTAIIRANLDPK
jgi:hypothetical protein